MSVIAYYVKLAGLLVGLKVPIIGLGALLLDGRFHATTSLSQLKQQSPDWIIARHVFKRPSPFGGRAHKGLGMVLIASTLYVMYDKYITPSTTMSPFSQFFMRVVKPITLLIIASAITIKQFVRASPEHENNRRCVAFL